MEFSRPALLVLLPVAAALVGVAASPRARAGGGGEPSPGHSSCATAGCHEATLKGTHVHGPAGSGECETCHKPLSPEALTSPRDKDAHRFKLAAQGTALCSRCHEDGWLQLVAAATAAEAAPLDSGSIHRPVWDGKCTACHSPHAASEPKLVRTAKLCASCHAREAAEKTFPHRPLGTGCDTCHEPHVAPGPRLLREATRRDACVGCHDDGPGSFGARIKAAPRSSTHGPLRVGGCTICHDPHGSGEKGLLVGPQADVCARCHGAALVATEPSEEATPSAFRDGDRNLHAVHRSGEKAVACSACHDPHLAVEARPHYLRATVPVEGRSVAFPFEAVANGGNCGQACHDPRTYVRGNP